jgi:hypothetical protein
VRPPRSRGRSRWDSGAVDGPFSMLGVAVGCVKLVGVTQASDRSVLVHLQRPITSC